MMELYPREITKDIILRLSRGDMGAFDTVYWKYNARIFHFIHSLLRDEPTADDLTQTAFLKIWENRRSIDPERNFESYLFTIARNLVYNESRRMVRFVRLAAGLSEGEPDHSAELDVHARSLREYLFKLIDELPGSRKKIFLMSREEGISIKEIARKLAISERTVETQLYRSVKFLKEKIAAYR